MGLADDRVETFGKNGSARFWGKSRAKSREKGQNDGVSVQEFRESIGFDW
jgi:hypothetical protein